MRSRRLKLGQRWIVCRCIVYTGIRLLLICPFISSFFFLSNFQTLKFFVTLFSQTVRPRRLKLGTRVESGQMYHVYRNQTAAAYSSPYFFIFFLSNFQTLKFFSHFYQELWGLEGWNLVYTWTVGRCMVYTRIRLLLLIHPFIFSFSNIQILKFSSHFSQELWGLEGWNLVHTWTMGFMHRVYQNQAAAAYLFLYFFIFLSLQFSNIKMFLSHLSQELWGLEGWNVIPTGTMGGWIVYTKSFHNIFLQNCEG